MAHALTHALDGALEATRALASRERLAPRAIAPELAEAKGQVKNQGLTLRTTIYAGAGRLRRLHVARGRGAMESLTVLGLAEASGLRPLFAADVVAFGDRLAVLFLDCCAIGGAPSVPASPALRGAREALLQATTTRPLPPFCEGAVSEHVVLVRGGDAKLPAALSAAYAAYLDAFASALEAPAPPGDGVAAQRDFMRRMAENKRESRALARLFGAPWAQAFLEGCFFAPEAVEAAPPSRAA